VDRPFDAQAVGHHDAEAKARSSGESRLSLLDADDVERRWARAPRHHEGDVAEGEVQQDAATAAPSQPLTHRD
jgi:hypothetical protein